MSEEKPLFVAFVADGFSFSINEAKKSDFDVFCIYSGFQAFPTKEEALDNMIAEFEATRAELSTATARAKRLRRQMRNRAPKEGADHG